MFNYDEKKKQQLQHIFFPAQFSSARQNSVYFAVMFIDEH